MTRVLFLAAWLFQFEVYGQGFWFLAPEFPGGAKTSLAGLQDSIIFTGTNSGIWRSEKTGNANSWQYVLKSGTINCLIATEDGNVVAGSNGKIYYSTDKGTSWDSVTIEPTFPIRHIKRNSKGEYFATTGVLDIEEGFMGNGVLYNDGSFKTWQKRNNGLSATDLFCENITIDKNDRLYLATANEYGNNKSGLFLSDDAEMTWKHIDVYIDGLGVIQDKITVHFVRGLSLIGDSLFVSLEGVSGGGEVRLNLIKHKDDLLLPSKWKRNQVNQNSISWWLDRVLYPIHRSKQGMMYSSIIGSANVGGTFVSEDNGVSWSQKLAGLGVSETGAYVQYFYETSYGKVFMIQHFDERIYWTDKSILDPVTISGKVVDQYGNPLNSVLLDAGMIGGYHFSSLSDGAFAFTVQRGWSGIITPERFNYNFSPQQAVISSLQSDTGDIVFTGIYVGKYYISGRVVDYFGNNLSNIGLEGFDSLVKTNENGFFVAEANAGWSGVITPFHAEYEFQPESIQINGLGMDLPNQDFLARKEGTIAIRGTFQGDVEGRIVFSEMPGDWVIESNGNYLAMVPKNWTGTIVPHLEGYLFIPDTLLITNLQDDLSDQNFTVIETLMITGSVKNIEDMPIENVELIGFPENTSTDEDGNFQAVVPKNWSGTFAPYRASFKFVPEQIIVENLNTPLHGQNFTGTFITSVNDPLINKIKIYPNPSPHGNITVHLPVNLKPISLQLFSLAGQKLSETALASFSETAEFIVNGKGTYILKIITVEGSGVFRVCVL